MKNSFRFQASIFKLPEENVIFVIVFSLFAVCCSIFTASAASAYEIRSKSAVVMEESTGRVLYGKNPNLKLPPASTTKLVTAMVVLDRLDLDDIVTVSRRAAGVSPIKADFRHGERVTVKTLLYAALIRSANDAALALAEAVAGSEEEFVELMNRKVLSLGLSDSRFSNASGLPGGEQYTTVYDLARIMKRAMRYQTIREIINTKAGFVTTENGRSIFLRNINRLLWSDDSMLGGKTGYTKKAGHCFVSAGEHDNDMMIVALLGAPSREAMWKESELLMEKGFLIKNLKEEAAIYFTKADYKSSVRKASYNLKQAENKKRSLKTNKNTKTAPKKTVRSKKDNSGGADVAAYKKTQHGG